MAPVPFDGENNNLIPIAYFSVASISSLSLLAFICSDIWRSSTSLSPLSNTRRHESQRRRQVILFAALAVTSFTLVLYYTVMRYMLSYEFWVNHHGSRQEIPNSLPGRSYVPANLEDIPQLGHWFASQSVPLQFYKLIAEGSRRFWWGQQYFAGLIAWSTFVGIEGHRRQLPTLTKLAFLLVAQFVSLSVAQNLFYITMLLKSIPVTSKDALRTPNQSLYITCALLGFFCVADLPLRHGTELFVGPLFGGLVAIPTILGTLPDILPRRLETSHKNVHLAHRSYATVFTTISVFALATHAWFTGTAILDNTPGLQHHHRSIFSWPLRLHTSQPDPSRLQRAETAVTRVLGALGDHPAVNAIGWDVLLSAVSLGVWCIVRGVDVDGMIECGIWPWHQAGANGPAKDLSLKHVSFDRLAKKEDGDNGQVSPTKKARGRPKRTEDSSSNVTKAASKAAQKVGEAASASTGRRRVGKTDAQAHEEDDAEDEDYVPDRFTAAELANLEHEGEHGETEAEAGALAWGLWTLGGLGVATASALGSEVAIA